MRTAGTNDKITSRDEDDSLFGLLSSYKSCNTYFRILINEMKDSLVVQITDNPKKWPALTEEIYNGYNLLKRVDIGSNKLFVNYLSPAHLIEQAGQTLGMKLPDNKVVITNHLDTGGYFAFETGIEFKGEVIQNIYKLINLSPEKKYEILEKCLLKEA